MALFKPYRITKSQLESIPIKNGQILFITDEKSIYLDDNDQRTLFLSDTTYEVATQLADGLLSKEDKKKLDDAQATAAAYTDQKIAELVNGAPETLDTLKEVADAIAENEEVVEALNAAIGNKVDKATAVTGVKGSLNSTYRTGDINISPEDIGAMPSGYTRVLTNNFDWNSLIEPGFYKIEAALMTEENHAPIGIYRWGTLFIFGGVAETRYVQMYIPHGSNLINIRMYNGDKWDTWHTVYSVESLNNKFLLLTGGSITGDVYRRNESSNHSLMWGSLNDGVRGFWDSALGWYEYLNNENNLTLKGNTYICLDAPTCQLNNQIIATRVGKSGIGGWVIIAQINIKENTSYINGTLEIDIGGRGMAEISKIFLMFESTSDSDPNLYSFTYYGSDLAKGRIRIKKTDVRTWQIAVLKNENYGEITIFGLKSLYQFHNFVNVTYLDNGTQIDGYDNLDNTWIAPTISGEIKKAYELAPAGWQSGAGYFDFEKVSKTNSTSFTIDYSKYSGISGEMLSEIEFYSSATEITGGSYYAKIHVSHTYNTIKRAKIMMKSDSNFVITPSIDGMKVNISHTFNGFNMIIRKEYKF